MWKLKHFQFSPMFCEVMSSHLGVSLKFFANIVGHQAKHGFSFSTISLTSWGVTKIRGSPSDGNARYSRFSGPPPLGGLDRRVRVKMYVMMYVYIGPLSC